MTLIIPETFAPIASHVERQYRDDETFRETYDDYLTYREAYLFWASSRSEEAPTRQREYADLVREMEDELRQILKSPSSSQSLAQAARMHVDDHATTTDRGTSAGIQHEK
jgi:hypothetical protein